jgi:hypothetical protein
VAVGAFGSSFAFEPPRLPLTTIPTLPSLGLSAEELLLIKRLQDRAQVDRGDMELCDRYYRGEQLIDHLGIAIPQELQFLRTLVGWPRIAVDPYVERLAVDGFRLPGATDSDPDLHELMTANGLDAEAPLAFTDALSMRRAYWTVGTNPDGGAPLIRAESPLNMSVSYGLDGRTAQAGLQGYYVDDVQHAALYTPDQTVHIAQNDRKEWVVVDRDVHGFGVVPVVRMANNPRTNYRDGYSEITPELRSTVDQACRTLLILAVAGELYGAPRLAILGATASDFQDAQGNPKTAWETYVTRVLALERDENGEVPQLEQLTAYDPSTFTKVLEWHASQASGILAASPQDLGLYTQGNPTSPETVEANDARRDRRARRKQGIFGVPLVDVMKLAIRFENNGALPAKYARMAVDWADPSIETPATTSDAITKYVSAGVLPAESDVTLKRARFSAVERAQIAQDRAQSAARSDLARLADAVAGGQSSQQPGQPVTPTPREVFGGNAGR